MLLIKLSLRNLLRQKRRNLMLGSAMTMGVAILIVANSFSRGISDIMFNKIMRYVTGHVAVRFNERGGVMSEIFRDRERAFAALKDEAAIKEADEGVAVFSRAIGNGRSDNIILIGVDTGKELTPEARAELDEAFRMVEGSWDEMRDSQAENPVVVSREKAKYLNLKLGDTMRVRFRNMFGQDQAGRLTVTAIMKNDNIFMQPAVFLDLKNAKRLFGYRPWESGTLTLTLHNPQRDASALADRLHAKFKPGRASINASVSGTGSAIPAVLLGYKSSDADKDKVRALLKFSSGTAEQALKKDAVILPAALARRLGLSAGGKLKVSYARKFEAAPFETSLLVSAVCSAGCPGDNVVLLNDAKFYDLYYPELPAAAPAGAATPELAPDWQRLAAPEWILLPRTYTTDDYKKKYQDISKNRFKGTTLDVSTMYESASDILKLESVLNIITISAVLVLFFIILLGVVNTLRMTIRERTREIGTVRAIGMQRGDVRDMFILETFFLTLFSATVGVVTGFIVMKLLTLVTFHPQDNPLGMLLVNGHLYFLPTFTGIAGSVLLIIAIAVITAWFPARRAANLSPAQALGHFT